MSFCVSCGKDCSELLDGMCAECWLDGRKIVTAPHHTDLKTCTGCGEFFINDRWVRCTLLDAVQDAAFSSCGIIREAEIDRKKTKTLSVEAQDPYVYEVAMEFACLVRGIEVSETVSTTVRIKNTVCKPCSRKLGNYYTSILQIRSGSRNASGDLISEALEVTENFVGRQAETNKQLFITKTEEVPGGIDVYLSSIQLGRSAAKELADMYCAEFKESPKLVGKTEDGQDMYRLTYLVRLPEYHTGDVVLFENRLCKLVKVSGTGGRVLDLMNFRERSVRRTEMPDLKVIEKGSELKRAEVISSSGSEIQVMNPVNYSVADLRVPEGFVPGESVCVTEWDDALYLVP